MCTMMLILSLISLLAWIYLIAFHGEFWRSIPALGPVLGAGRPSGAAKVAVVVPARNEAETIGRSVGSLLMQGYAGDLAVILVDDNSTDGTAFIAAGLGADERLIVIPGAPLPRGWSGKLWAVHQGLAHDKARYADYVLLTDADIEHGPGHVAALVAKAEADGLDLVSEMVRLHCATAAEHALIPAFVFFFQMLYPFAWVADPGKRLAGAAGGTMLVRRAALDRIEGVSRIRHHLIDDCALAGEIKSTGGRIWLGHSEQAASIRVYGDWREIWNMIARTAFVQLKHSLWLLLGCVVGMGMLYCIPPLAALFAHGLPRLVGILAWLMMALAFQPTLRRYGRSPSWGLALPAIALFYLCATVASAARHFTGQGGGWKNRTYPEAPVP
jgi:hopene-associated glycosyltransferase HpnB